MSGIPNLLVSLDFFIAFIYIMCSLSLAWALSIGVKLYDSPGHRKLRALIVLGFGAFLLGCGLHHIQHALALAEHGCMPDMCETSTYVFSFAQVFGGATAAGGAVALIFLAASDELNKEHNEAS